MIMQRHISGEGGMCGRARGTTGTFGTYRNGAYKCYRIFTTLNLKSMFKTTGHSPHNLWHMSVVFVSTFQLGTITK